MGDSGVARWNPGKETDSSVIRNSSVPLFVASPLAKWDVLFSWSISSAGQEMET